MTDRLPLIGAMLLCFSLLASGCISEIDREIDCVNICDRYANCLPGEQDRGECRDRCDNSTPSDVDDCDACLDTSDSCTSCTIECAGPLQGA